MDDGLQTGIQAHWYDYTVIAKSCWKDWEECLPTQSRSRPDEVRISARQLHAFRPRSRACLKYGWSRGFPTTESLSYALISLNAPADGQAIAYRQSSQYTVNYMSIRCCIWKPTQLLAYSSARQHAAIKHDTEAQSLVIFRTNTKHQHTNTFSPPSAKCTNCDCDLPTWSLLLIRTTTKKTSVKRCKSEVSGNG